MVRTQIQLTDEQAVALRKMALAHHISMAKLIRRAVDTLVKSRTFIDEKEKRERAIEAAGQFHSGINNFSLKHDKYLSEAFK